MLRPFSLARPVAAFWTVLVLMLATGMVVAQPVPPAQVLRDIEPLKLSLEQLETAVAREGLTDEMLVSLRDQIIPLRDDLRGRASGLDPRLAEIDTRLRELGAPPAKDAPPEDPGITKERDDLKAAYAETDAALRQIRLLAVRADQLLDRISERRRQIFARELFERSPSVFDPGLWREAAEGLPRETRSVGIILSDWAGFAGSNGGPGGVVAFLLSLVGVGLLARVISRRLQGWHNTRVVTGERFSKAVASLRVALFEAITLPLGLIVAALVAQAFGLVPDRMMAFGASLLVAVIFFTAGRGIAHGVLAPGAPDRRLLTIDEAAATRLYRIAVVAALVFAMVIAANAVHRAVVAPVVMTIATSALGAAAVAGLLAWTALRVRGEGEQTTGEPDPRAQWLRLIAWVAVAVIAAALVIGYVGFAAFIAGRVLWGLVVIGALILLLVLVDATFGEVLAANAPRGRAIATTLGLKPRTVELLGTLVAGLVRVMLIVAALLVVLGPWGIFAADAVLAMQGAVLGLRIGDFTLSLGTIFSALMVLVIGLLATRGAQRWLETRFLPRTTLEPSLQLSVSTILGYVGFILTIALALAELGINLQNIALVAGALSVGIGFGLQSIVSNFVSGLILLAERPIRVGDSIVVRGEEGYVRRISVRATEIETFERATVLVPNSELVTGIVKNWTHSNTTGRVVVKVTTPYDVDTDQVRDLMVACACDHPQLLQNPPPRVFLLGFGDNGLQFELRCIVANVDYGLSVRSDLHFAILHRFRQAGIDLSPAARTAPATPGNA